MRRDVTVPNWDTATSVMSQRWRVMDKAGYRQLPPPGIPCSQQREAAVTPTLSTSTGRHEEKSGWRHSLGAGFCPRQCRSRIGQCYSSNAFWTGASENDWVARQRWESKARRRGIQHTLSDYHNLFLCICSLQTQFVWQHAGGLCQNFDIYKREAECTDRQVGKLNLFFNNPNIGLKDWNWFSVSIVNSSILQAV